MVKEILFYVYLPNKKNIGYMVKYIKTVHLINNGSILSTVK